MVGRSSVPIPEADMSCFYPIPEAGDHCASLPAAASYLLLSFITLSEPSPKYFSCAPWKRIYRGTGLTPGAASDTKLPCLPILSF